MLRFQKNVFAFRDDSNHLEQSRNHARSMSLRSSFPPPPLPASLFKGALLLRVLRLLLSDLVFCLCCLSWFPCSLLSVLSPCFSFAVVCSVLGLSVFCNRVILLCCVCLVSTLLQNRFMVFFVVVPLFSCSRSLCLMSWLPAFAVVDHLCCFLFV